MTDDATRAQIRAARPDRSTWLTANAGSGKTRVLTNRVARLLLRGEEPQNILCLTYTTAAASEMQNRLFKTLGHWAMLGDAALRDELRALGEDPPEDLSRARTLFASAIEAPGGLKIQTIHSFCARVLRQFPLEAGVNPQFTEMDDSAQTTLMRDVITKIATHQTSLLARIRRGYSGDDITNLAKDIAKNAESFDPPKARAEIFAAFGVDPGQTFEKLIAETLSNQDIAFLKSLIPVLDTGKSTDIALAEVFAGLPETPTLSALQRLEDALLTKGGAKLPFSLKLSPTKDLRESARFAPFLPEYVGIGERVEAARRTRIALDAAETTDALHRFAEAFLPLYQQAKTAQGMLDFDDLIRRTRDLLTSRSLQWVLYRLDGRIDHILVDEAQDTSPAQWDVIGALSGEIVAGHSERERTLFIVGDKKQSIYSFQGADAEGFDARGKAFRQSLSGGPGMAVGELLHSFRSAPAILDCVDAVFSTDSGAGDPTRHSAFRDTMPGRVDLWDLIPRAEKEDEPPWYDPRPRTVANDATHQLAEKVAEYISDLLRSGTIQGKDGSWRRILPGDIMILVQRRSALFDKIISACKARDLDIAGADVLKLGSELAVRDILALLSFLTLPENDLALATALRSPLLGWSEGELYDLAAHRPDKAFLWQALRDRRTEFAPTFDVLTSLRHRVDHARPFELINAILTEFGGRQRLLRRIGQEAEDGIDELLNQALAFEIGNVPTLTGFLETTQASDISVKRQSDASGNLLRVMTVHGAKGLESPIVILPDTTSGPARAGQYVAKGPDGIATLTQGRDRSPPEMQEVLDARKQAEQAERDRLLYVAMTRAEKWLIVCGAQPGGNSERLNWHEQVEGGLTSLGAEAISTPSGGGLRFAAGTWKEHPDSNELDVPKDQATLAEFGPSPMPKRPAILSPSKLGGDKVVEGVSENGGGVELGRRIHVLLEHLPDAANPSETAQFLLDRGPHATAPEEIERLCDHALSIISSYPQIFAKATLAEVDITGFSPTLGARISGSIDRLVMSQDVVSVVDFKTNAIVPGRPEDTPESILRQMGAYLEALESIYPDHRIELAILWTTSGTLMPLEHAIVREALARSTTS